MSPRAKKELVELLDVCEKMGELLEVLCKVGTIGRGSAVWHGKEFMMQSVTILNEMLKTGEIE